MKNKLSDLANHLYVQMERLNDESLKGADLELECQRADAMAKMASNIISASNTTLTALRLANMTGIQLPTFIKDETKLLQ